MTIALPLLFCIGSWFFVGMFFCLECGPALRIFRPAYQLRAGAAFGALIVIAGLRYYSKRADSLRWQLLFALAFLLSLAAVIAVYYYTGERLDRCFGRPGRATCSW